MSLEQVLTGAPENTPVETPAEQPAEQPPQSEPSPEPKVEQPAEPTAAPPEKTVPLAALEDERRKRQEYERRLQQYERQQQPKQEKPGFWEQPEQYLETVRNEARMEAIRGKLDITEDLARSKYQDYDDQLAVFGTLIQQNPNLLQQMLQARNPAEFAYSVAKNHATVTEAGSIEAMREKIRAEERAKIEAEIKAKAEAEAKKRDAIPNTLTDVQSGAPRTPEFTGPTPLDAILK
jgi:hypothetical protein